MSELTLFDHLVVGPLDCNCYIVGEAETREAIVIDPGGDADLIAESLAGNRLRVSAIVATHAHFDHVIAAEQLRDLTGAPFYMHGADRPLLDWFQESGRFFLGADLPPPPEIDTETAEGDRLTAGSVALDVLHTPGHSPGSISLASGKTLFVGDTLFAGSVGRTDLPGGSSRTLVDSVREKLFPLGDDVVVYPGHGPESTLERERRTNPFVGEGARLWLPE
ncbi:MAG: MBL fold metallo-hydrolase [Actinomycetota bacterium]